MQSRSGRKQKEKVSMNASIDFFTGKNKKNYRCFPGDDACPMTVDPHYNIVKNDKL